MNLYDLPTTLEVNGTTYEIRTDYRAVLDILVALNDPDLSEEQKYEVMLRILYPDYRKIPVSDVPEALKMAVWFIDCGQVEQEKKRKPKLMDWEQDASLIIAAINSETKMEVRSVQYMHWWTFFGYYMSIGESLFSTVLSIRSKKARGKKLDDYEKEFYRENRKMVDLKNRISSQEQEQKDFERESIERFLNGGGE